jgi:D-arabinose 1-dehydrogenase-like Zn-dependent alcohol dehydrogenase
MTGLASFVLIYHPSSWIRKWLDMYSDGLIKPIGSIAAFEPANIEQCFRHLQKGDHIGKAIVTIPQDYSNIISAPQGTRLSLTPESSYLITGGLGGLGRSLARWLVDHGAAELIFLSRSAGKGEHDQSFFEELRSMGCNVITVAGKAESLASVEECAKQATKPIKGICHLAMVLRVSTSPNHHVRPSLC